MSEVVVFPAASQNPGNGARETIERFFNIGTVWGDQGIPMTLTDRLITYLWLEGFKVVPHDAQVLEEETRP